MATVEQPPFKRGDLVRVESENEHWFGFATIHAHNGKEVSVNWLICNNRHFYYKHNDGCDAYVPAEWCTKIEVPLDIP